jgi:lycopene cyclase domain-containing protein
MNYLVLNAAFIAVSLLALLLVPRNRWPAYLVGLVPMLLITALFDNLIILSGIVGYDASKITGEMIGLAPIEDFAYTIAAVAIVPSVWSAMANRKKKRVTKND